EIQSLAPYSATDGANLAGFNGSETSPTGVLSQSFPTVPGTTCTLTFDAGALAYNKSQQKVLVSVVGSGSLLSQIITITGTGGGSNNWGARNFTFVANSSLATLKFTDISTTTSGIDLLLDKVSVKGPQALFTQSDSVTIHAGQKVLIPVLKNDTGAFIPSSLEVVDAPAVGTVSIDGSSRILYTHSGTGTSPVTFSYRVSDGNQTSSPTTVTVNITSNLRITDSKFNVPSSPPPTAIGVVPAFPGVGFSKPVCFSTPPGDTRRLFVCELDGQIKMIPDVTATNPIASTVLDLAAVFAATARNPAESIDEGADGECGLLGLAFHPNYANNGFFYIAYSVVKEGSTGWFQRLSRFTMPASQLGQAAPVADPTSELILIEQADRDNGHNGGDIHFGADGYLYYSVGDEGAQMDGRVNSQRINKNFFSAMLRIDVDKRPGSLAPNPHVSIPTDGGIARYSVPANNPFVGATSFNGLSVSPGTVRTEFWAVGFRSPWRFSIDEPTGEIWLGDVGQDLYEEVDIITKGGNYGWVYREGKHDTALFNPTPPPKPAGFTSIDPIYEYNHPGTIGSQFTGNSIIGGVVYRGTGIPSLTGSYIFGDFISGNIWSLTRAGGVPGGAVTVQRIAGLSLFANFGTDPSNKDVLVSDFFGGRIMRITSSTLSNGFPTTLSATGLFSDLSDLSPAPGLLPYEPILPFWSDYAIKRRWFAIPDATSKMTWSKDGNWTFPTGQIWVKHFDLETERGNLATKKRIETRLLVRNATGAYGVSYRWNEEQTEATLADDGGEELSVNVTVGGVTAPQNWSIPSRAQCMNCHNPVAGHALSFNTRQLNMGKTINGFSGNQIDLLSLGNYLSNTPEPPATLPRHVTPDDAGSTLEVRARSYLAVNCSYCHQPGGSGTGWDGRAQITLAQTGLINGASGSALNPGDKLIILGDATHSQVLSQVSGTNGYKRMPPLGSNVVDQAGINLLRAWIMDELPTRSLYAQWSESNFTSYPSAGVRSVKSLNVSSSAGLSISALSREPAADPDGDGLSNYTEYLLGSPPLSGTGSWRADIAATGDTLSLRFLRKAYRIYQIESSDDMKVWHHWDHPANVTGYNAVDTWSEIQIPACPGGTGFFRFHVSEP
ncbi:MAG: PQQ-dependent sugar dehydrogenase, partial [Luteolibacter sp.]